MPSQTQAPTEPPSFLRRLRHAILGAPRDVLDPKVFHKMSLVAFLAWVGLGSDGLSSSAYGPDECFRALLDHGDLSSLAVFLMIAMVLTVLIISSAYSRVIEHFPSGGGGYLVATKLLGSRAGLVSGCALLVDYVLTITVSVAAGGDAVFNLLPLGWQHLKVPVELVVIVFLIVMNLRGVKESVQSLIPVFLLFVATHLLLIGGGIASHAGRLPAVAHEVSDGVGAAWGSLGGWGVFLVFLSAYTRGGGTYTGIEAVSNGIQIMREPRVETGKRTMLYMGISLAVTASGILFCYLLFDVRPAPGKTLNGVLVEAFAGSWRLFGLPVGKAVVFLTLVSEGALLLVAAQTGFIDGPRVMANMAVDSWLPHRFASLSDRLTTKDGVLLMGLAAIALLLGTRGSIDTLVVMYAVNVFVTFSLTTLGMLRLWIGLRGQRPKWKRNVLIQLAAFGLCLSILVGMVLEKFTQGAWLTLVITTSAIVLCWAVKAHYGSIARALSRLDQEFADLPGHDHRGGRPDPKLPTAVLLVGGYGGVGIHSMLSLQHSLPNYFKNLIFVSAAVIDSGSFKGEGEVERLRATVEESLRKYVELARRLGWNADYRTAAGIDPAEACTHLCFDLARDFPHVMFFAGKLLWKRESWFQRILHNETAYQIQRRLQWKGLPMAVLPLRVRE